jgi:hypothetical protein
VAISGDKGEKEICVGEEGKQEGIGQRSDQKKF